MEQQHITSSYLHGYLGQLGYQVRVQVENRATKRYNQAYTVYFDASQALSAQTCQLIATHFPDAMRHVSPTRVFLPTPYWRQLLPFFPRAIDQNPAESKPIFTQIVNRQTEGENTPRSKQRYIHTIAPADRKAQTETILALVGQSDFATRSLSTEETRLVDGYYSENYYSAESYRDYPLEPYVPQETLDKVAQTMYQLAFSRGFVAEGKVLDPYCGPGRFIKYAPMEARVTGITPHSIASKIAQKRYSTAKIYCKDFEEVFTQPNYPNNPLGKPITWLEEYPFDLIIGCMPAGRYSNLLANDRRGLSFKRIEHFYLHHSAKLLMPGGLLVVLLSSHWMGQEDTLVHHTLTDYLSFEGAYLVGSTFNGLGLQRELVVFRRNDRQNR